MAGAALTIAQIDLINSLSQDDIPIKLRCAICSRLAVNAFRLPCCDQAICETCQSTLPSTCPVCEHSPVGAEDCKPNKSLRTTIRVFLRTEEKKREAVRLKEEKEVKETKVVQTVEVPSAPVDTPVETTIPTPVVEIEVKVESPSVQDPTNTNPSNPEEPNESAGPQQDIPQPSIEEIAPGQESTIGTDAQTTDDQAPDTNNVSNGDVSNGAGNAFGFDATTTGGFPAMGMNGDLNQMQMMMAMQNGMGPGGFGFPMMGMPGMGMDPMAMQSMFMNGGFGAAGMGMNAMVGQGGFDSGHGGFNGGWNAQQGQQGWNVGQDNFIQQNSLGLASGDFGANNSGYASNSSAGFNQGNFGRPNHNDYQNNHHGNNYGYQSRGRGRGRGGFGRGGYGYASHDQYSQQLPQNFGSGPQMNGTSSEHSSMPTGPKAEAANVDEFGREIRPVSETEEEGNHVEGKQGTVDREDGAVDKLKVEVTTNGPSQETSRSQEDSFAMPIQTLDTLEAVPSSTDFAYNGNFGPSRGVYQQGHPYGGSFNGASISTVKPVHVPINAPTGPKAMREGLPNTSLRGRGYSMAGRASSRTNGSVSGSVVPEVDTDVRGRAKTRSPSRDGSQERRRSRSKERQYRRNEHRSDSVSEDEKESERRRERRRERRKRREEDEARDIPEDEVSTAKDNVDRSRSASPGDHKRSSHRSRRERDKYSDRERDREHKSSSNRHRSHRSHREERSRSRDKDREHRHRHSRRDSVEPEDKDTLKTSVKDSFDLQRPSIVSNSANGLEIRGASSKRGIVDVGNIPTGPKSERVREREKEKSSSSRHHNREETHHSSHHRESESRSNRDHRDRGKESKSASSAPPVQDPHTLEREARNRERLLKEAQRMAGFAGGSHGGRKRSRDDGDGADRKGRKKGRRSGHSATEDEEEARIARLEAEREGARWD